MTGSDVMCHIRSELGSLRQSEGGIIILNIEVRWGSETSLDISEARGGEREGDGAGEEGGLAGPGRSEGAAGPDCGECQDFPARLQTGHHDLRPAGRRAGAASPLAAAPGGG